MPLPDCIARRVRGLPHTTDTVGCSRATLTCYDGKLYCKREPAGRESRREREMLVWLQGRLPVPELLEACEQDGISYLLMTSAPGETAISDRLLRDPPALVRALAESLRLLWSLDVRDCPADATLSYKLAAARRNIDEGLVDLADFTENNPGETPRSLFGKLSADRPDEDLVFSHGDFCLPNVFLRDGKPACYIDLGRAGVADRWQDIALCVRSLAYNVGSTAYTPLLYACLGVEPDEQKRRYYTLLDELF